MKAALLEPQLQAQMYGKDSIIRFDEGLIGFNEFKNFVLVETEEIKPFRVLQSADSTEVAVVVLDPRFRIADYYNQIPGREWEAIGGGGRHPGHYGESAGQGPAARRAGSRSGFRCRAGEPSARSAERGLGGPGL